MIHFLSFLSTSWKTEASPSCVSDIACGSYIPQKAAALYGMACRGFLDAALMHFVFWRTQIEFEVTTEGVT
jgi:hypothetical protein